MLLRDNTLWLISKDKMSYSTQTLPGMLDYTAFIENRTIILKDKMSFN